MFGKNIKESKYNDLPLKIAYVTPKLLGGSMKIGFINANGVPSGNKNLFKYKAIDRFM